MLDVLGEAALRTLLLAATVQLGLWLFRIRRAHLLLVTWTVVLAASLAMPALQWATPWRLPMVHGHPAAWLADAASRQQADPVVSMSISSANMAGLPAIGSWLAGAYLLVGGIMVLRLAVGVALSLRLLRRAVPSSLGATLDTRVRISPAVGAPVTVGNVVLLPPDAMDWPPAMRQAAIAHECAHVTRGDFALLVLSQFNRAVFWFSPLPWLLHRQLAALAELASDDHAIRVTGDRTGYAEALLEMGRRSGPLLRGLAMARASTLRYRIERVLADRVGPVPASLPQRWVTALGATVVAVAVASPDFTLEVPPGAAERGRPGPVLAPHEHFAATSVQDRDALRPPVSMPPPIEGALRPPPRATAPLPRAMRAALPQSPGVQVAARPTSRAMASVADPSLSVRTALVRRVADTPGDTAGRAGGKAVIPHSGSSGIVSDSDASNRPGGVGGLSYAAPVQRDGQPRPSEPSLLKAIDQQTCHGVYLPGSTGGTPNGNGWGYLNVIRAKFFHEADGTPWLKFYLGTRDPVNLPVKVTDKEVEFIAAYNTAFKILPQGTNHLSGNTQRPNGTIDLACGEAGAYLFDRKS